MGVTLSKGMNHSDIVSAEVKRGPPEILLQNLRCGRAGPTPRGRGEDAGRRLSPPRPRSAGPRARSQSAGPSGGLGRPGQVSGRRGSRQPRGRPTSGEEGVGEGRAAGRGLTFKVPNSGTSRLQVRVRRGAGVPRALPSSAQSPPGRAARPSSGLAFLAEATPGTAPLGRAARPPRGRGPSGARAPGRSARVLAGTRGAGGAERCERPEAEARARWRGARGARCCFS